MPPKHCSFVTGFPSHLASNIVLRLLQEHPTEKVVLLLSEQNQGAFERFYATLTQKQQDHIEVMSGNVVHMDLGLAGAEYQRLLKEVREIYHVAAVNGISTDPNEAFRYNVEGTAELIRLAEECRQLKRFAHFSSAQVSGDRTGVIQEEDLDRQQRFRNALEESRFRSERLLQRVADDIPVSIFRPSIVVGHSETGRIDRMSGPYYLMNAIVNWPVDLPMPLPGKGDAPLNLVPVDFVAKAAVYITRDKRGLGRTFHLTDPNPLPARAVFSLVAKAAGKPTPRGLLPTRMARSIMRLPGLNRVAAAPRHFLEYFDQLVIWRCVNTLEILQGTDIRCPTFESYVGALVDYIRERTA